MNATTSFEANQEEPGCAAPECPHVDDVAWGRARADSPGHGTCRSSFLEPPAQSFLRARDHKSKKARGSCRSRGRQERAHRSLGNRQTGFPQLPPALSSFSDNRKSVTQFPVNFVTDVPGCTEDLNMTESTVSERIAHHW